MNIGEEIVVFWVRCLGITNLVNMWFGWMNVGFDAWFMYGMMFGDDWV